MKGKNEIRLGWNESKPHYHALKEIEINAWAEVGIEDMTKNKKKRIEVIIHNETREYLKQHNLTYKDGGFYTRICYND